MKHLTIVMVVAAMAFAGCTSSTSTSNSSPTPATGGSPSPSTSPLPPNGVAVNLTVTGSNVTPPQEPQAKKGQIIVMTTTTVKDEEVHLHGYDIHFDCKAGQPLTQTFTADKTGQFEIELEATSTHLTNFSVLP